MHGTFNDIATVTVIDSAFAEFIGSLYESGTIPALHIVDDIDDARGHFKRSGCIPVLSEDETEECTVFDNWGTYYEFEGWLTYRAMSGVGNEFQLMVADVLATAPWSSQTKHWIDILHALVVTQEAYADKFGDYPVNLDRFIKTCITSGADVVLLADVY
ncbi:hypothetical protein UP09_03400 [Bradyrhizobium sp. LTSP885]|uniref:hypothetical protein n=1 Tax=Bradyrhizobium sp. LTSP885 TaxID=1619232 RepID=UPI0005CB40E9|nr:hypothetical protein [Bradyrhizobium sp. LTSP885]KJC51097.1 hypothetical protein UP09_03400 [Bradyrhizobium sp. LTSP885]